MRNLNLLIALFLIALVAYFGIVSGNNLKFFLNSHALILVLGGTIAIFIFSTPPERIKSLYKILVYLTSGNLNQNRVKLIKSLYQISLQRYNQGHVVINSPNVHPFLLDVVGVLNFKEIGLAQMESLLNEKINITIKNYSLDSEILNTLGKYPPAMGLLGATSGIIGMMKNLGQSDKSAIGNYMATALVATIWGIGVANFFILPLADLILQLNKEAEVSRKIIAESMLMSFRKENPEHVLEYLVSHIPLSEQNEVRAILKTNTTKS